MVETHDGYVRSWARFGGISRLSRNGIILWTLLWYICVSLGMCVATLAFLTMRMHILLRLKYIAISDTEQFSRFPAHNVELPSSERNVEPDYTHGIIVVRPDRAIAP